jgi:general secretion pathway protein A
MPDPDDLLIVRTRLIAASKAAAETDIKAGLAEIDAAMARHAEADQDVGLSPGHVISPFAVADVMHTSPELGPQVDAPAPRRETAAQPIASTAEYRSRLNWFIGVADVRAQDPGSLTYEPYFGLREKPFSLSADPRFFFSGPSHGAAFDTLAAGIRRREGVLVLTGEVGTGKTTLCRAVLQSLDQKTFAAFVPDPFMSREDLLKTLLLDFGIVSIDEVRSGRLRGASRTDLSYPLYEFLTSLQPLRAFAVVMIDEAQNLEAELLEEIRVLSDLENGQKLLEVVLVGQPELQRRFAAPDMRQLSQRVTIRCELSPLAPAEVEAYIWHRLKIAGHDGRLEVAGEAIEITIAATSGIPRLINLVCDRALLRAARSRRTQVYAQDVIAAIGELKLRVPNEVPTVRPRLSVQAAPAEPVAAAVTMPLAPAPVAVSAPVPSPVVSEPVPHPVVLATSLRAVEQSDEALPVLANDAPPASSESDTVAESSVSLEDTVEQSPFVTFRRLVRTTKLPPLTLSSSADEDLTNDADQALPRDTDHALQPDGAEPTDDLEPIVAESASRRVRWLTAICVFLAAVATGLVGFHYSAGSAPPPEPSVQTPARESSPVPVAATPEPTPPPSASASASAEPSRFAVQIASFRTSGRAEQAVQELQQNGYQAYSAERTFRDGSTFFAVLLGPYADRTDAERDRAKQIPGYDTGLIIEIAAGIPSASSVTSQK